MMQKNALDSSSYERAIIRLYRHVDPCHVRKIRYSVVNKTLGGIGHCLDIYVKIIHKQLSINNKQVFCKLSSIGLKQCKNG